ncbi:MAG: 50S ribosomal protein L37ae [Candidatus Micrarchaeia archaeon]|jgi:ribosomal protein eL43
MVSKQVRGGTKIRKRAKTMDKLKNDSYECPTCRKVSLKRVSNAVWKCNSCGSEFAGGAYTPTTTPGREIKRKLDDKN